MSKTPDQVANLVGWWKADALPTITDPIVITSWPDSSVNGNDLSQPYGGTYAPVGYASQINGLPALKFDNQKWIQTGSLNLVQPITLIMVNTLESDSLSLIGYASPTNSNMFYTATNHKYSLGTADALHSLDSPVTEDSSYHVVSISFNGSSSGIYVDGNTRVEGEAGTSGVSPGILSLGGAIGGYTMNGHVAEIILFSGVVSTSDRQAIESYLGTKYGITVTEPVLPMITAVPGVVGFIGDSITIGYGIDTKEITHLNSEFSGGYTFSSDNRGISGTQASDWVTGGADLTAAIASFSSSGAGTISVMLGTNDAIAGVSSSTYQGNLSNMITGLVGVGVTRIVLNIPPYVSASGDASANALISEYISVLYSLAASDPSHVFVGDTSSFSYFQAHQDLISVDGVHPTDAGAVVLSNLWAEAYERLFPIGFPLMDNPNYSWIVAPMAFPVANSTYCAVTLNDGDLLIIGGWLSSSDPDFPVPSPHAYNEVWRISPNGPNNVTVTQEGTMQVAKAFALAIKLSDGKVLIVGGANDNITPNATCDIYDPVARTVTPTGNLNTGRTSGGIFLLPNGKVLYAGGGPTTQDSAFTSSELYDPVAGTWSYTGSLNVPRTAPFFGSSGSGIPVMIGGLDNAENPLSSIETYNYLSGTWSIKSSSIPSGGPYIATMNTTVTLVDGTLLFGGGQVTRYGGVDPVFTFTYNADTDTLTQRGNLNFGRYYPQVIVLQDGSVMYVAGYEGVDGAAPALSSYEIYNPTSHNWSLGSTDLTYGGLDFATQAYGAFSNGQVALACGIFTPGTIFHMLQTVQLFNSGDLIMSTQIDSTQIENGNVVKSLNSLTDSVTLAAGSNITITPAGNTLTIASTGGGGGGKLLQTAYFHTNSGVAVTSGSFQNTSLSLAFTPVSSTSTIVISSAGTIEVDVATGPVFAVMTIFEDSTDLGASGDNGLCYCTGGANGTTVLNPAVLRVTSLHGGDTTPRTYIVKARIAIGTGTTYYPANSFGDLMVQEIEL